MIFGVDLLILEDPIFLKKIEKYLRKRADR
jgi:hypothetical protein